jgi:hypothetical protein
MSMLSTIIRDSAAMMNADTTSSDCTRYAKRP